MPRVIRSAGATLVDLLMGLVVASLLLASAHGALVSFRRVTDALVLRQRHELTGSDVIAILEAIGAQIRDPRVLGDSALHGEWRIGAGVVCQASPSLVTLAPAMPGRVESLTSVATAPAPGDRLDIFTVGEADGSPTWHTTLVSDVQERPALEGCGSESPYVARVHLGQPAFRIRHEAQALRPHLGAPVELYRAIRVLSYRDAAGHGWMVGVRQCLATGCGSIQPVAGPVRSPRDGGLIFRRVAAPELVEVTVRTPGSDRTLHGRIRGTGSAQ